MTVIAYRDGVLAADTLISDGDSIQVGIVKIIRRQDGALGASTGRASFNGQFRLWLLGCREQMPAPQRRNNGECVDTGYLFHPNGEIECFEEGGSFTIRPAYFAGGSGGPEALGAMFAGADAETAVRAAIEHDAHCGGEVTVLRHAG